MQLRLLNFHKILSQFASNVVGAFLALIVYQSTNSFTWAFLFMAFNMVVRIVLSKIFYKAMAKKPQVFLAIRLIPFLLYSFHFFILVTIFSISSTPLLLEVNA